MAESDASKTDVGTRPLSLEEQLSKFPPELLDRPYLESHLGKIIHDVDTHTITFLATNLEHLAVEVDNIRSFWPEKSVAQRLQLLKKWKEEKNSHVTYRKLITALHEAHKPDVIDNLLGIVTSISQDQPIPQLTVVSQGDYHQTLVQYGSYLKEQHLQIHTTQRSNKWPRFSLIPKAFNLVIVKEKGYFRRKVDDEFVYQTTPAQVDDILFKETSIELEKIFVNAKGGEQNLILIEGGPGSSKTTLSVYIYQSWSRGELFQEFSIVILVQLQDPAVQSARAIADLLPCQDKKMSAHVARAITDVNGRGILWILDGWDELPQSLCEDSFLRDIFTSQSKSPIAQSSVIIMSRPESSGILSALATLRIDLLGFTREQQRQYFTECLKGDVKSVDTLIERLNTDPAIGESFYLPLNTSIITYCYSNDGTLPTNISVQGIFSSFVEHFLSHYRCDATWEDSTES